MNLNPTLPLLLWWLQFFQWSVAEWIQVWSFSMPLLPLQLNSWPLLKCSFQWHCILLVFFCYSSLKYRYSSLVLSQICGYSYIFLSLGIYLFVMDSQLFLLSLLSISYLTTNKWPPPGFIQIVSLRAYYAKHGVGCLNFLRRYHIQCIWTLSLSSFPPYSALKILFQWLAPPPLGQPITSR